MTTAEAGRDPGAGVFTRERRPLTVGILLAITAFAAEGMGVVPALPVAVRELGGLSLFGWAFSAFMLAWLVGTVGSGLWSDARGPRWPMAVGLSAFAGGLLFAGLSRSMIWFLAGRVLQGAGGGGIIASAYVAIARGYPDELRARIMALTASVWILPAVAGPALSGAITQWLGWRYVFVGILPLLCVTAFVVLPPLARFDIRVPPASARPMVAALRVAAGSGLLLAAPGVRSRGWVALVALLAAGLALLVPALLDILPPGTIRARRGLPAGMAVRGLLGFGFFGTEAFIPLGMAELRGATPTEAGLALSAGAFGWIAASWIQDRIESRGGAGGRADRVRGGLLLIALAIALVAAGLLTQLSTLLVPLGWLFAGAGMGAAYNAVGLLCIAAAPPGKEGEVSGQLQVVEALGTAAGAGVGGLLIARLAEVGRGQREAHAAVFFVTLSAVLVGLSIARRTSNDAPVLSARPNGLPTGGP